MRSSVTSSFARSQDLGIRTTDAVIVDTAKSAGKTMVDAAQSLSETSVKSIVSGTVNTGASLVGKGKKKKKADAPQIKNGVQVSNPMFAGDGESYDSETDSDDEERDGDEDTAKDEAETHDAPAARARRRAEGFALAGAS